MAYQVIARKWRPQRFDDVIGQQAVTRTLRNAIGSGRIAHAFVFAGQRGSGKTTTARILARALNCVQGPTPDPCGVCDACLEIAQGRGRDGVRNDAVSLIARAAEGSMRDAQSALDQVIAFAGNTITAEDVSTVLGLVGRDLLFDLVDAVVAEDAPAAFALADRAVASGHDLRLVVRELTRVVRDLMIVSVDPSRVGDGELGEGERERLTQLASRFSREDLMRAFDLLANAEQEIRTASHPRYQFEMLLLKWMHTRKLLPLTDLLPEGGRPGKFPRPNPKPQNPI